MSTLTVARHGTIDIAVASGAALEPPPMPFHQGAPAHFTRLFDTISVTCISDPSGVAPSAHVRRQHHPQEDFASGLFDKALKCCPRGSAPTVEEVGRVTLFLATDASAQVTGQTISVDGGLSFGGW